MGAALKFSQIDPPKQKGEQARLRVVRGPDTGSVFVLTGESASIGRGQGNDIPLGDPKASRKHARLVKVSPQGWEVQDLGSSSGIGHQGQGKRRVPLMAQEQFSVGDTVLEWLPMDGALATVDQKRALEAQRERVRALGRSSGGVAPKSSAASGSKSGLLFLVAGAAVAWVVLDPLGGSGGKTKKTPVSRKAVETAPLAGAVPLAGSAPIAIPDPSRVSNSSEVPAAEPAARMFLREAFREYRVRNYLRARLNFENVLQLEPGNSLARLYLSHSLKAIEDEISQHLEQGRKSASAGRLRSAKGHFESVQRLLARKPEDPRYLEASRAQKDVERALLEGGL